MVSPVSRPALIDRSAFVSYFRQGFHGISTFSQYLSNTHTRTDSRSRWWPTKDAAFSERNIIPFLAAFSMLSRYHRRTSSLEEASYPVGKPAPCKNLDKSDISGFRLGIQFPRMSSSVFRCRGGHDRELSASILITNEPSLLPFPCFDSLFRFEKGR